MAGRSSKANAPKPRKRVEVESANTSSTLLRAKDGSAFARCEECKKDVPVVLISMHNCSLDAKIKMNLEAQVVEQQTEKKPAERKKPTSDEPKPKRLRKVKDQKKSSASNKPKRPLTAFFLFIADFRKTFKEENPGSGVKDVAKQGGEKWHSMTEEEKKPYLDKASELKAEYKKLLESNNAESEEEGDVEKKPNENDEAEENKDDEAEENKDDEAEDNEVDEAEEKEGDGKEGEAKEEEEILDDY